MRSIFLSLLVVGLSIIMVSCGNMGERGGRYSDMELNKPPKDGDKSKITLEELADRSEEKMLTLILGENDQVHWFQGTGDGVEIQTTNFEENGVRNVIVGHLGRYPQPCSEFQNTPNCWDPIFVIKPSGACTYGNVVDILDEMKICQAPKYAMGDFTEMDSLLLVENGKK